MVRNMDWIISPVWDTNYILDACLKDCRAAILVTYETLHGRRYVKQVECMHGRISKKIGGKVIAWMPAPEPYRRPEKRRTT